MNKKIIVLIGVVIVICIIAAALMIKNVVGSGEGNDNPEGIYQYSSNIIVKSKVVNYNTNRIRVEARIPQFENLESSFGAFINNKIYSELDYHNVYNELKKGLEDKDVGDFSYEVTYERYNFYDFISLVVTQNIEFGGSRPTSNKKCYVVNARKGQTAGLKDVFANKTNYKGRIMNEINKQAQEKGIEIVGGNGITSLSDSQAFYVKQEKLHIYFKASEIAPAAAGELDFEMPFVSTNGMF